MSETKLRKSTQNNPVSQEELLAHITACPEDVFKVMKVAIPVSLTKASGGERIQTNVLSRDGRKIEETTNVAKEGFMIDTRSCINGQPDQYAKKPEKAAGSYTLDDGRSLSDLAPGETAKAHTVGGEMRRAIVAEEDMWLATTWGENQFVAKGGLITFSGNEAIGNNNPCDLVLWQNGRQGSVVLTEPAYKIRKDADLKGIRSDAIDTLVSVCAGEDRKNEFLTVAARNFTASNRSK